MSTEPAPAAAPAPGPVASRWLPFYAGSVLVVGALGLVAVLALQLPRIQWGGPGMWVDYLLAGLLFAGELRRIQVILRDGQTDRLTVSSTFAVALVVTGPIAMVLIAQLTATALDDLRRRRDPLRIGFNVGQYVLTLVAARAVYALPQGLPLLQTGHAHEVHIGYALAAALTYFVVNNVIVGRAVALAFGRRLRDVLIEDLRVQSLDSVVLLGLAPVTAIIAVHGAILTPVIVLPLLGVERNARIAGRRLYESLHDNLTGLPNRALFGLRAGQALEAAAEVKGAVALMLLDLDHFKDINDTLGHHVGDEVLREVSKRMTQDLPEGITVARLGGDEFAVVVPAVSGPNPQAEVAALAETMMARIREPLTAGGIRLGVQASLGYAVYPEHGESAEELLRRADVALYQAKNNRGEAQGYRTDLDPHSVRRLTLHGDLQTAVENHELTGLEMFFQPQVDSITRRPVSFEALMRWDHPVHGPITPETFIPMAESTGLIAPLTRFSVEASLATLADLVRHDPETAADLSVAVNLSARVLADLGIPDWLGGCLREAGLPARRLTVEVTESSITADPIRAAEVLAQLRELGIRVAIDDFGTGYSSLSWLAELQPDELKIDKSFVQRMLEHQPSGVIVRSTVDLAHSLGLTVVAEGVEDQTTFDVLAGLGCDRIQGYHVARAMSADVLGDWTRARHGEQNWAAAAGENLAAAGARAGQLLVLDHYRRTS